MDKLFAIADVSAHAILYLMGILSLVSVSIIIQRVSVLKRLSKISAGLTQEFTEIIEGQKVEKLEALAKHPDAIEGKAIRNGLNWAKNRGTHGMSEIFDSYKMIVRPGLEKNLALLGTIASNAPYLGLLGTVMGIMKAFNDLAAGPGQGNEVVMAGISHALISTAIGLAVAIPAVVGFNLITELIRTIMTGIDTARDLCMAFAKHGKE